MACGIFRGDPYLSVFFDRISCNSYLLAMRTLSDELYIIILSS